MDRQIVYAGSIPLDTDLIQIQRNVLVALGAVTRVVLGTVGLAEGFACTPGSGAYTVTVAPGSFTAPLALDGSAFGALAADPTLVMQTATQPSTTVLQLTAPQGDAASQTWLVQVKVVAVDAGPVALPYWNAANPTVPYSGPGNSGLVQNTQRQLRAILSCKTGITADAGNTGLYVVTTYAGKPGIATTDIALAQGAPFLRYALPAVPPAPTRMETFGTSASWHAPAGVTWIRVGAVGAGGGGGGGDTGYSGGGGGAGGYAEAFMAVAAGQVLPVVVGAPGLGGAPGQTGGNGGASGVGELVLAAGGGGGGSANPVSYGGAPGEGLAGTLLQAGGYGTDGVIFPNVSYIPGGSGGASIYGGGGRGADPGGLPSFGRAAGSGGGGGYGAGSSGGQGAGGLVTIEY